MQFILLFLFVVLGIVILGARLFIEARILLKKRWERRQARRRLEDRAREIRAQNAIHELGTDTVIWCRKPNHPSAQTVAEE